MKILRSAAVVLMVLASSASLAEVRTVTLSVPGMTCSTCPITVRKALSRVPGVSHVEASYETRQAVVTFDDAQATIQALTRATANAGYPSALKK